jgi:hypothetical protein
MKETMNTFAEVAQSQVVRYSVNREFTQAILVFSDESRLLFEHSSRENRWAKASRAGSLADRCCQLLQQFRLNAKHLQLYFADGSDVEFIVEAGQ